MKSKKLVLIFLSMFLMVLFMTTGAVSGKWQLYDDFDTGIDSNKWDVQENGGVVIAADNGRARFSFSSNDDRDTSSWLEFIDCPENIVAIKATFITENDCPNGAVRGRIAADAGTFEGMTAWSQIDIHPGDDARWAGLHVLSDRAADTWFTLFMGDFRDGIDLNIGSFVLEIFFDKKIAKFRTDDLGEMMYRFPSSLGDVTRIFKGIGLRANSGYGNGNCTFYVDDVYVMRKGPCDNKAPMAKKIEPKKKFPRDDCWVHITFNEPMACCWWNIQSDPNWPMGPGTEFDWSGDMKTISVKRNNCGSSLPPNSNLEFIVNPNGASGNHFRDLKGNAAKTKKLKIKTEK